MNPMEFQHFSSLELNNLASGPQSGRTSRVEKFIILSLTMRHTYHSKKERHHQRNEPASVVMFTSQNNACTLLDWSGIGEIIAKGRWSSSDLECTVHNLRLRPHAMRVWLDVVKKKTGAYMWRPNAEMSTIDEAKGSTIAWPANKVIMRK